MIHDPLLFIDKLIEQNRMPPSQFHTSVWSNTYCEDKNEGYVIRNAEAFPYSEFKNNCAKYVRENHVTTDTHWKHGKILTNIVC